MKSFAVRMAAVCAAIAVLAGCASAGRIAGLKSRTAIENAFIRAGGSVNKAIESIEQIIERSLDLAGD